MESCQGQQLVNESMRQVKEPKMENEMIEEHVEFFLQEDAEMTKEIDTLNQRVRELEKEVETLDEELKDCRQKCSIVTAEKRMMRETWESVAMRFESAAQEMYISFRSF
ncbi:hypothetical protein CAEBREN_00276 [Caenorhabditis brenneri]|uniref:Uncharacterized protein n=1 Tax=Caenorhabditis brenneri TaxID=135651 RepID=G0P954_CAEBE|nr:hypothetical protein CAEBREN_00276 [Caenorhabditis brenneri]